MTAESEWEGAPRGQPTGSVAPSLDVDGFAGPLDWLLELVRAERIDLRKLSILDLVQAFATALDTALANGRADLSQWGEWLAMAAQLTLLRSRLLLPPSGAEADAARADAEALRRRLLDGEAMRRAAIWLQSRPQLGREMFGVGVADRPAHEREAGIIDLFRACLVALRVSESETAFAPGRPPLWRVSDAMARITHLLDEPGRTETLGAFLPRLERQGSEHVFRCRAALASTTVAALELCRVGAVALAQRPAGDVAVTARDDAAHSNGP